MIIIQQFAAFDNYKATHAHSLDKASCTEIIETKPKIPSETLRENSAWKDEGMDKKILNITFYNVLNITFYNFWILLQRSTLTPGGKFLSKCKFLQVE